VHPGSIVFFLIFQFGFTFLPIQENVLKYSIEWFFSYTCKFTDFFIALVIFLDFSTRTSVHVVFLKEEEKID
jgi:hypothetical protein